MQLFEGKGKLPRTMCWVWETEARKCIVKRSGQSRSQVQES